MAGTTQCFYALVARKNSNLFKAAYRKLPEVFRVFAAQVDAVARPECRVYPIANGSIESQAEDEILRRCRSKRTTIDVFCETETIKSTIEAILAKETEHTAKAWLIGPPPDDYSVIWAQVALLHSLRLVATPTAGWSDNALIVDILDRVDQECAQKRATERFDEPEFASMEAMVQDVSGRCASTLVVTDDAIRSARNCQGASHIGRAHALLTALSDMSRDMSGGRSIGQLLIEKGFDYKASDSPDKEASLKATCCGKEVVCGRHVRFGIHSGCVRVHFERCDGCSKFVVQHCGEHL